MTTALGSSAIAPATTPRSAAQRFSWFMGVAWIVIWLTNLSEMIDVWIPFPTYYLLISIYIVYLGLTRLGQIPALLSRPVFLVWTLSALIPILLYFSLSLGPYAYQAMKVRIVAYSVVAGTGLILMDRRGPEMARQGALISLAITVSFNLFEFSFGNILGTAPGRAAGFFENPNASGAAIIVGLLLAVDFGRHTRQGLFVIAMGLLGILVTFSRAGILFGTFLALAYIFLPQGSNTMSAPKRLGIVFAGAIVLSIALIVALEYMTLGSEASGRLYSILRADFSDMSSVGRLYRARQGLDYFLENFWTGMGLGSHEKYGLGLHNAFAYVAVEYGVFGLILYLVPMIAGILKVVQFGWMNALNSTLLAFYVVYNSFFAHFVHSDPHYGVAFGVLMVDGLIPRRTPPPVTAAVPANHYTFQ